MLASSSSLVLRSKIKQNLTQPLLAHGPTPQKLLGFQGVSLCSSCRQDLVWKTKADRESGVLLGDVLCEKGSCHWVIDSDGVGSWLCFLENKGPSLLKISVPCPEALTTSSTFWKKVVVDYEKCDAAMMELRGQIDAVSHKMEGVPSTEALQEALLLMPRWMNNLKESIYSKPIEMWTRQMEGRVDAMMESTTLVSLSSLEPKQREAALDEWNAVNNMLKDAAFLKQPIINNLWANVGSLLQQGKASLLTCKIKDAMKPFCEVDADVKQIDQGMVQTLLPLLSEKDVLAESLIDDGRLCWDTLVLMLTSALTSKEAVAADVVLQDLYTCSSRLHKLLRDACSSTRGKLLDAASAAMQLKSRSDQDVEAWSGESNPRADLIHSISLSETLHAFVSTTEWEEEASEAAPTWVTEMLPERQAAAAGGLSSE